MATKYSHYNYSFTTGKYNIFTNNQIFDYYLLYIFFPWNSVSTIYFCCWNFPT